MADRKVRFAAIGFNHGHIYGQIALLLRSGAELVSCYAPEPELVAEFHKQYPQVPLARSISEILDDPSIDLVTSAGIPCERAPLGLDVMRHGKDFFVDKPGFTTLEQLERVRCVQAEQKRIYSVFYGERLENPSSVKAAELVNSGAIGDVVQTIGLGPHRAAPSSRPPWFFKRQQYGGILCDIGSHQFDQFLFYLGCEGAQVISAQVANYRYPQHPELEDFGDVVLRSNRGCGYLRVDWYSPDGLNTWGDGRLTILGTEGYIEIRKNCDLAGRSGGHHLFLINQKGTHYFDCQHVDLPFGPALLRDVVNRTEAAMPQAHCFLASELALRAQASAVRLGNLKQMF
ncbi:MAG TPA: Gfo/Idh/MocA family oxidoreductase [Planctomycetota bacterium]|jgi:predicted dehydrogenase